MEQLNPQVLCVLGGEDSLRNELSSVEWLDPVTGKWRKSLDMQEARLHPAVVLIERRGRSELCAIGGSNGGVASNTAEVLCAGSSEWEWIPDMQDCRLGPGCGLIDTRVFVAGGSDRMSGEFALNTVEWFDVPSNQWRRANNMNRRRQGCCCCVIDGLLYAIGGGGEDCVATETCEVYDPETDEWSEIASMGIARMDAACVVLDGMVVVMGGSDGIMALDSCEVYDPESSQWSRIADMCERRQGCAAASNPDGTIYAMGGMDFVVGGADSDHQMRILDSAEVFDKVTHTWKPIASMNSGRRDGAAVVVPMDILNHEPEIVGMLPQV
eukprot:TRINITY_DN8229_c0_g1_i1.p2 TRINITY_DN8229_c0_g1~~TRINITY_DN8229_c0_g1_i1.p2  ORF type:complete len:326 (+),score=72.30 TRINITY_DN8229_c0_g1_i1:186-1163(+)